MEALAGIPQGSGACRACSGPVLGQPVLCWTRGPALQAADTGIPGLSASGCLLPEVGRSFQWRAACLVSVRLPSEPPSIRPPVRQHQAAQAPPAPTLPASPCVPPAVLCLPAPRAWLRHATRTERQNPAQPTLAWALGLRIQTPASVFVTPSPLFLPGSFCPRSFFSSGGRESNRHSLFAVVRDVYL